MAALADDFEVYKCQYSLIDQATAPCSGDRPSSSPLLSEHQIRWQFSNNLAVSQHPQLVDLQ